MAAGTEFDYYYGGESNQFSFYRIPRQFVTGERSKRLSTDESMNLILPPLRRLLARERPAGAQLILHSDQGTQLPASRRTAWSSRLFSVRARRVSISLCMAFTAARR